MGTYALQAYEKTEQQLRFSRWTEPSPGTFAPTRWALINTRGSPTWAFHSPPAWSAMVGGTMFTEYMTDPATMDTHDIDSAPFVLGWHKLGNTQDRNYWGWMQREPEKFARFALSMEGMGQCACDKFRVVVGVCSSCSQ